MPMAAASEACESENPRQALRPRVTITGFRRQAFRGQGEYRHARHPAPAPARNPNFWSMAATFGGRIEGRWPVHCPEGVCAMSPYPQATSNHIHDYDINPQWLLTNPLNLLRPSAV